MMQLAVCVALSACFLAGSNADPVIRSFPVYSNHTANSTTVTTTSGTFVSSSTDRETTHSLSSDLVHSSSLDTTALTSNAPGTSSSLLHHASQSIDPKSIVQIDNASTIASASSHSTSNSSFSTTKGIGAFIAAGLGISSSTTSSATGPVIVSNASMASTMRSTSTLSHNSHVGQNFLAANSTVHSTAYANHATGTLGPLPTLHNSTHHDNSTNDTCWAEWNRYWALVAQTISTDVETIFTYTASSDIEIPLSTTSYTTELATDFAGTYIRDVYTITQAVTEIDTYTLLGLTTDTEYYRTSVARNPHATTPACVLPSHVPDCQSSWNNWATHQYGEPTYADDVPSSCYWYNTTLPPAPSKTCDQLMSSAYAADDAWYSIQSSPSPACTQASIGGAICDNLRDEFFTSNGGAGMWQTTPSPWPGSQTLAPSCTVGCGQCRVTGGTVQLFYWPPATSSAAPGEIVTATGFGTTFTSPTVYISFDSLYASDFCSGIGTTIQNTILPITNSATLSSIYGWNAGGLSLPSASFNFTDLYSTPVPQSIYESQVWCGYLRLVYDSNVQPPAIRNFSCPRHGPYEPLIQLPDEVRNVDPAWASCIGALDGAYDPPLALSAATAEAVPTQPGGGSPPTTSPAPGSTPTQGQSGPTSAPVGQSDQLPSKSADPPNQSQGSSASPTKGGGQPATPASTAGGGSQNPGNQDPGSQNQDPSGGTGGQNSNSNSNNNNQNQNSNNNNNQNTNNDQNSNNNQNSNDQSSNEQSPNNQGPSNDNTNGQSTDSPNSNDQNTNDPNQNQNSSPAAPSDALDVLESAVNSASSSANTATPNSNVSPNGGTGSNPGSSNQGSNPVTVAGSNGESVTASPQGSSAVIINQGGSQVTVQAGQQTVVGGHTISVASSADSIVVDGATQAFVAGGQSAITPAPAAVLSAGGQSFTATRSGNSVLIAQGGSTITLADGAVTTIDGETISAVPSGKGVVIDGSSTITFASKTSPISGQATFTEHGHTITAAEVSGAVVVWDGSSSITVKDGSSTIFEGETISVPSNGGTVVVDGTTSALDSSSTAATTTGAGKNDGGSATGTLPATHPTPSKGGATRGVQTSLVLGLIGLCVALYIA